MVTKPDIDPSRSEECDQVRFREPDRFAGIRTPGATNAAGSITSSGVRTGREDGSDEWLVESVLIEKHAGEGTAREQAREIVAEIES